MSTFIQLVIHQSKKRAVGKVTGVFGETVPKNNAKNTVHHCGGSGHHRNVGGGLVVAKMPTIAL